MPSSNNSPVLMHLKRSMHSMEVHAQVGCVPLHLLLCCALYRPNEAMSGLCVVYGIFAFMDVVKTQLS